MNNFHLNLLNLFIKITYKIMQYWVKGVMSSLNCLLFDHLAWNFFFWQILKHLHVYLGPVVYTPLSRPLLSQFNANFFLFQDSEAAVASRLSSPARSVTEMVENSHTTCGLGQIRYHQAYIFTFDKRLD